MKKIFGILASLIILFGCSSKTEYEKIDIDRAIELMENDSTVVIDVRSTDEYNNSHLTNSINIPVDLIDTNISNAVPDKDTILIVYCRSGNRSETAAKVLVDLGYTNVYDLGGIIDILE